MTIKKKSAPNTMFWERISSRIKRLSIDFWISVAALTLSISALLMKVFAR